MKKLVNRIREIILFAVALAAAALITPAAVFARDVESKAGDEVDVWVNIGEPTEINFPAPIQEGYRNTNAGLSIQKKADSLVVFGKDNINDQGEAILVRLQNGQSYSLRIRKATADNPKDAILTIGDGKGALGEPEEDENRAPYKEQEYGYAPASRVSGLMREMVLVAEFGKSKISGYTISDKFKGQTVVSDGAVLAKIDKIFIGPNLWGYVLDATNLLDQSQRVNPATFRIDGTRAVSVSSGELAARPINVEEQIAGKHNTKVYVVTRAR